VIAQTRAELLKLRSTRTTIGLVLATAALILLFALLTGLVSKTTMLTGVDNQRNLLGVAGVAGVFAAIAGALLVTGEYRFGTIRPTLLYTPRRSRVILAKLAVGLLCGLVFGAFGEALSLAIGATVLSERGVAFALGGGDLTLLVLGTLAGTALWGAIGVAVGAIVRNQVAAVVGLFAWTLVVENLLIGLVPAVGRYGPVQAAQALGGSSAPHALSAAAGGGVLVGWVATLSVVALALTARRDIG
jgi:ABC-2 type transport system permease protein